MAMDAEWRSAPLPDSLRGGACVEVGIGLSEVFFAPRDSEDRRIALSLCESCRVRAECLEYAMALPAAAVGIWGGTTAAQRWRMRRAARTQRGRREGA